MRDGETNGRIPELDLRRLYAGGPQRAAFLSELLPAGHPASRRHASGRRVANIGGVFLGARLDAIVPLLPLPPALKAQARGPERLS